MLTKRCEMCGAYLNIASENTKVECEYCGTVYILSKTKSSRIAEETVKEPEVTEDTREALQKRKYEEAVAYMEDSITEGEYRKAAAMFRELREYKDAEKLAGDCIAEADSLKREAEEAEETEPVDESRRRVQIEKELEEKNLVPAFIAFVLMICYVLLGAIFGN